MVRHYMQLSLLDNEDEEVAGYLSEQIITYIGNKRSLLPFIGKGVEAVRARLGGRKIDSLDLFSGSGVVSRYLKRHSRKLYANDMEGYSRVANQCYLTNRSAVDYPALNEALRALRRKIEEQPMPGFIAEMYSPKDENNITTTDRCFYTRKNAIFLDTAASHLSVEPEPLRSLLLGPLLSRASVHANTSGVFKGFYKNKEGVGQFGGSGKDALTRITGTIDLDAPLLSRFECESEIHQSDANVVVHQLKEVDLAYLDPPYNQHPYGSNYFMLNLLVDYKRPAEVSAVSGIPVDWRRSRYNARPEAEAALFELVRSLKAKFVLISYNSEGFVSYDSFTSTLEKLGKLSVLETTYNTFRGSRNLRDRPIHLKEYLFLLEKK
jgi:adenine-specific DNA-methyltransferase